MTLRSCCIIHVLAPLLLSACVAEQVARDASVSHDSAAVLIVENTAPVWTSGHGWRLDTVPQLSIGVVEGPLAT